MHQTYLYMTRHIITYQKRLRRSRRKRGAKT